MQRKIPKKYIFFKVKVSELVELICLFVSVNKKILVIGSQCLNKMC